MNTSPQPNAKTSIIQQKFNTARANLLLMIGFTLINIILLCFNSETMFLFSATVPYYSTAIGKYSEIPAFFTIGLIIAAVTLIIYFFCWIFSKKHYGWLIAALVLFSLDSIFMITLYIFSEDFSGIIDLAIHIWVIYYLIIGVKYGAQLKNMPETEEETDLTEQIEVNPDIAIPTENTNPSSVNSIPLRSAHTDLKTRILLEGEFEGHKISYRRVKRINELVIDGYVYDDVEMLIEFAHALNAKIDGHDIQVGFDGATHSYLRIDGVQIARKLRLW